MFNHGSILGIWKGFIEMAREKGHTFPRMKETHTKEMTSEEIRSPEEKQRQEGQLAER